MKAEIALRQALGKPAYAWFLLKLKYPLVFAAKLNCLAGGTLAVLAAGTLFQTGIWPAFVLAAMWVGSHLIAPNLLMTSLPDDRQLPKRLGLLTLGFYVLALTGAALYGMRVPDGWRILLIVAAAAPPLCAVAARLLQFFLLVRKPEAAKGFGLFVVVEAVCIWSLFTFGPNNGWFITVMFIFGVSLTLFSWAKYTQWKSTNTKLVSGIVFHYWITRLMAFALMICVYSFLALVAFMLVYDVFAESDEALGKAVVFGIAWLTNLAAAGALIETSKMDAARRMASAPVA